ncbi:hypothetical protein MKEN_01312400 [Mycena kentingensis (nom. inval.)]|nr:hypothetical protein MKEN_01312400 [Mycena kentingensis (nom. inval.)]
MLTFKSSSVRSALKSVFSSTAASAPAEAVPVNGPLSTRSIEYKTALAAKPCHLQAVPARRSPLSAVPRKQNTPSAKLKAIPILRKSLSVRASSAPSISRTPSYRRRRFPSAPNDTPLASLEQYEVAVDISSYEIPMARQSSAMRVALLIRAARSVGMAEIEAEIAQEMRREKEEMRKQEEEHNRLWC